MPKTVDNHWGQLVLGFGCQLDHKKGPKMCFFGLFRAIKTTIGIQNPKLIVTNDYQQFLAHFEWFLSLFQISDIKYEFLQVKLKVRKNGIFLAKNLVFKNFSRLFLSPIQVV